jgi:hypothetical protein
MARKMSRFDHVSAVERKKVPRAAACPFVSDCFSLSRHSWSFDKSISSAFQKDAWAFFVEF